MPQIEVSLREDLLTEFEQLADEEFMTRDEAVEELLSAGIDAYTREPEVEEEDFAEEYADDIWDTAADDPSGREEDDDYAF